MRLKKKIKKGLNLFLVYVIAGFLIFAISERVERLNIQDRIDKGDNITINIDK